MAETDAGAGVRLNDQLMARVAQGDHEALHALYTLTRAGVYGFALSITGNFADAQDVTQDTYLRAYQAAAAGQYKPMGKPMAWLLAIARNLARMKLRESARRAPLDEISLAQMPDAPPALSSEDRMVLSAALHVLGEEEKQVVMLHAAAGLKHREIAALLSLPLSTVLSKYHRALAKLRTTLQEADP